MFRQEAEGGACQAAEGWAVTSIPPPEGHVQPSLAPAQKPGATHVSFITGTPQFRPVTEGRATLH